MSKNNGNGKGLQDFEERHGGSKIKELEEKLSIERAKVEALASDDSRITISETNETTLRFGLTGDRHFGSLYHDNAALRAFYAYCIERGIKDVFDAGDFVDGHKIYRGQEFELRDLGYDRQIRRVEKSSPTSIKTHFITGNHCASFKNLAGAEVGREIENRLENHVYLGDTTARYKWVTPNGNFILDLLHPDGGTAYALSYKPQKIAEALEGGTKPDMLAIGHFHKAELMPMYRNICTVQVGCFQRQTPFMARKGSQAHVGGWIVEVVIGKNKKYKIIRPEFIAFY
jgi:UDP-2,3-diacylglucosamine pyrophosphatase LpxH